MKPTDLLVEELRQLAETKLPICLECRTLLRMAVTAQELGAAGKLPVHIPLNVLTKREVECLIGGADRGNPPLEQFRPARYTSPVKENDLAEAVCSLTCAVIALGDLIRHQNNNQAVLCRIAEMEERIMAGIDVLRAYLPKQKEFNERHGKSIDSAVESINGLVADIKALNDKITELQNSSGAVTEEDAALINELQTQGQAVTDRAEATAVALKVVDDQTPPAIPPPVTQ